MEPQDALVRCKDYLRFTNAMQRDGDGAAFPGHVANKWLKRVLNPGDPAPEPAVLSRIS